MTSVPIFSYLTGTSGNQTLVGLKIQPASAGDGTYVPLVALDTEAEITIGSVSQEGTWTVGLSSGSNEIGFVGPSGSLGVDYSTNAPSLSGLTLLATIPASSTRFGYFIQNQSTASLTVVLDDQPGSLTPTIIVLGGAASIGGQGSAIDMGGLPHTGRIRIFSTSSGVQMAARAW